MSSISITSNSLNDTTAVLLVPFLASPCVLTSSVKHTHYIDVVRKFPTGSLFVLGGVAFLGGHGVYA